MAFRAAFWKTFLDFSGWRSMLVMLSLVTLMSVGIVLLQWRPDAYWPEHVISHYALNKLLMVSFFWISGFFLAFLVVSKGAAFIAREAGEGTLLILVSKPVKRRHIVLGKLAALVVWAVLLTALLLLFLVLIMRLALGLSDDTLVALLKAVPWLVLYSAVVALFFGTVATALSSLTKNVIPIMVVMACLVMFVFLLGPLIRGMIYHETMVYVDYHLYVWDLSYHLGNAAMIFQERASGGMILPEQVTWLLGPHYIFAFDGLCWECRISLYHPPVPLGHVGPFTSLLVLLVISLGALRLSVFALDRKDVH